jgi:hypothetical protein
MKYVKKWMSKCYDKLFILCCIGSITHSAFANNLIPISSDETPKDGSSVAAIFLSVLQKDILPILEVGGAVYVLYASLSGIWKGYHEYQRERDLGPFKSAVISAVALVVFGGIILYLIDQLRSYSF